MKNAVLSCPFTLTDSTSRVLWEVTGKCNLNCRHCLYFNNQKKIAPDLTIEQMTTILDDIAQDGQIKAIWISGGEPLLRKDLIPFVQEISKRGITPSISTNGTMLTGELVEELYNAGVRYVHLSIDGTTAAVHDWLRNTTGAFDAVMRGIDYLNSSGIRKGASYMVTWDSVTQVPEMITLGLKKGLDVLSFYLVAPIGRGTVIQDSRNFELMNALEEAVEPYRNLPDIRIEVFRTISQNQRADPSVGLMECKGQCFYTITNDGHLASCPWFAKNDFSIEPISLLEMNFSDAKYIILERMEKYLQKRKNKLTNWCVDCIHKDNCGKGCPAVGDVGGIDPLCGYLR